MSGDKIPPINPVTGKFITPSSGNKVYNTRQEVVEARISKEIALKGFMSYLVYIWKHMKKPLNMVL